jgi:hypothetical protein
MYCYLMSRLLSRLLSRPVSLAAIMTILATSTLLSRSAAALPPPEDTPEEILRNHQIFEARSPVDGQPLSIAEYQRLQAELRALEEDPLLSSNVRQTIFLLRILKAVRVLTPF